MAEPISAGVPLSGSGSGEVCGKWQRAVPPLTLAAGGGVLLLTCAAGLLRFFRLGSNSLWIDEFATLQTVTLPLSQIARTAAEVAFCPPLYFWLVHGVVIMAGLSEVSLRLVSAVSGTLTIPIAWLLAREITENRSTATICAALVAVSPLHIWYSQEARPYALLICFSSTALFCLMRAMRTRALGYWAGFIATMAALLLTHTTGAVMLVVAWSWVLLSPRRSAQMRPLLIATALVALITMPAAVRVTEAVAGAAGMHSPPRPVTGLEIPYTLLIFVVGYSFGPSTREIQNLGPVAALRLHPLESTIGVIATGLLILAFLRRTPGRNYFLCAFALPLVAMLFGSVISGKAYQPRYALMGVVGFYGLAATSLSEAPRRLRAPATAAALLLCAWSDAQWYYSAVYWKDNSRGVVTWLADRLRPGSAVVTAPGYVTGVLGYYATLQKATIHFIPIDSLSDAIRPAALLLTRLHHVPNPRAVRARFRGAAGRPLREANVGGYQVFLTDDERPKRPSE